jgi:hypothetical protein
MFLTQGKFRFQILATGVLGLVLAIAGTAVTSHAAGIKSFSFTGAGSLVSSDAGACGAQTCMASSGDCGCLTYSGTGKGTKIGAAAWTLNQTTNNDDVVLTGLGSPSDRCYPTESDGTLTSKNGQHSLVFHTSGWSCEFGGEAFFAIDNTIYLSPGSGKFSSTHGAANMAATVEFSSGDTILSINGALLK